MATLLVSIYDNGFDFDAAIIEAHDENRENVYPVSECYKKDLRKHYWDENSYEYEKLIARAKELNFNTLIVSDNGKIEVFDLEMK